MFDTKTTVSRFADSNPVDQEDCASAFHSGVEYGTAQPGAALANGGRGPLDRKQLQSRNPHDVVKLFWHAIESDAQQKSFQRMSRRQNSRWISVMIDDVPPLELGHILQLETITRRSPSSSSGSASQ
jgi:hypothetical protein